MVDIIHRVGVKAPAAEVYAALATVEGVAKWWTRETSGDPTPGGHMDVQFSTLDGQRIGGMGIKVVKLDPDKCVQWRFDAGPDE